MKVNLGRQNCIRHCFNNFFTGVLSTDITHLQGTDSLTPLSDQGRQSADVYTKQATALLRDPGSPSIDHVKANLRPCCRQTH